MKKYYQYPLSKQFRERGINMSAWAEKHNISCALLRQLVAEKRVGKRRSQTRYIMQLLKQEGFTLSFDKAA